MMNKLFVFVVCALAWSLAFNAHATAFNSEAAWRTAVGGVYAQDNFDTYAAGTPIFQLPALGVQFDPLNDGTQPTVQPYSFTGGVPISGPNNLLNDADNTLPGRGPFSLRAIDTLDLLFGVGLWNAGGDDTLRMTFLDAADQIIEQVVSATSSGFFGIVNASGAARVEIDFVGGNGYAPVDNLQTAVRQTFEPDGSVPEPASFALAVLGLAAIGARRRRC